MLTRDGYTVCLESALRIKRSMGISRGKNDKKDARDIAEYAARHYDKLVVYQEPSQTSEALRTLFTQRRLLVKQKSDLQRRNKELTGLYKDNPLLKKMLASDKRIINAIDAEIEKIEAQMKSIIEGNPEVKKVYDILTSMKGIALVNAVALIVYTDNFKRFDYDARRICSYWGIAPFANQYGTSINGKPHVSHFADHYLKSLLSQAVVCAIRFCPDISNYAQRLLARKKHISIVHNNCKNKMIHILVAMVKNGTLYGEIQKN
jgi:transposase